MDYIPVDISGDGTIAASLGNPVIEVPTETDHSQLDNLAFDDSGHTGFQRELTAGAGISIQDGTITNTGVRSIAMSATGSLTIIQGANV